jgi:hypothetical protein
MKAKLALRRKKYQESLLAKTDAQLHQLEQLTSDVEFALVQKDVMYGIQQGTAVLQEIHKEMGGIEQVEKLMGDNAEARAYQEVRQSATIMRAGLTVACNRKSASSLRTRCQIRTKTKWKTSSRRLRPRSMAGSFPTHPCSGPSSQQSRRWLGQKTEQRGEQRNVLRSRRPSPCWHSVGDIDYSIRAWRFAFDHLLICRASWLQGSIYCFTIHMQIKDYVHYYLRMACALIRILRACVPAACPRAHNRDDACPLDKVIAPAASRSPQLMFVTT